MDNNREEICSEKYYKKGSQSTREAQVKWLGFTYNGAKLFNMQPVQMKKIENTNTFKLWKEEKKIMWWQVCIDIITSQGCSE